MKLGKLFSAAINTVLLPVDVVKDVVTLCGRICERESYTMERVDKIEEKLDQVTESSEE